MEKMSEFKVIKATKIKKRIKIEEIETILVPEAREYFYEKIEKYSKEKGWLGWHQELPIRFYKGIGLYIGTDKETTKIRYFVRTEEEQW